MRLYPKLSQELRKYMAKEKNTEGERTLAASDFEFSRGNGVITGSSR